MNVARPYTEANRPERKLVTDIETNDSAWPGRRLHQVKQGFAQPSTYDIEWKHDAGL